MDAKAGTVSTQGIEFHPHATQWREFVFGPRPHRTLCRVVIWSVLAVCFFHNLLVPIQIIGSSMYPTYRNGSLNFVNRLAYTKSKPHRGEVIALYSDGELLLKRIIAVPGEYVSIHNGKLTVNDKPLADEFSRSQIPWEMEPIHLGVEEYFVIGDNRAASVFCRIGRDQIMGRIMF